MYRAVLSDAKDFLALPSRAGASTVDKAEEKKAAALAVLVEALYELEEWDELLQFAQVKLPTVDRPDREWADGSRLAVVRDRLDATAERAQTARRVLDRRRFQPSARDSVQDLAQDARRAVPPARRGSVEPSSPIPGGRVSFFLTIVTYRPRMAVWLRAVVVSLLHRRELDEALTYIENAAHFIGQPRVRRACFAGHLSAADSFSSILAVNLSIRRS